jgi:hypothetical protein
MSLAAGSAAPVSAASVSAAGGDVRLSRRSIAREQGYGPGRRLNL